MVGTTHSSALIPRAASAFSPRLESLTSLHRTEYSPKIFVEIVSNYMSKLNYSPRSMNADQIMKTHTYQTLLSDLAVYDIRGKWFEATCLTAATLVELPYPNHPPDVKIQMAKFNWYLLYVDDMGNKIQPDLQMFQQTFFTNQKPENKVLGGFVNNLADMYRFWDPIAANCISASGVEFVTGLLIEEEPRIQSMKISDGATSWPNFLRVKTGGAAAFAFFLFPKSMFPDISSYIQVVDDVAYITNHANDLLSYYKEALAGEMNNYVHARAHATKKDIPEALRDIADGLLAAHTRISEVLKGTAGATTYNDFMFGLLDFHFMMKRYRLGELAF
ncbi:hypothetical protein CVT26_002342 [Gymnopilus dilepis]|uniref:Terpene synthase n=1 Tax=Gymnopilus dilepis TaxID=231916 RepID=A0A409Y3G7_9AGAR|nr:hypothetical protein CVT26_002342 [Gymnopilus dilepis]